MNAEMYYDILLKLRHDKARVYDKTRPHVAAAEQVCWKELNRAPYGPDLAPLYFHRVPNLN